MSSEIATKQYTVKEIEKLIAEAHVSDNYAENVNIASNLIFLYMHGIKKSDGLKLIKFNLAKHFNITDSESKEILKQKLAEVLKNHEANAKRNELSDDDIKIPFNEVAERMMRRHHIFVMRDTGEFFLYKNGVYKRDIARREINRMIRDEHKECYIEQWYCKFPDESPGSIPAVTMRYIAEAIDYITAYRFCNRTDIDMHLGRYINFRNGLFDIETWELIPHTPDVITIAQVDTMYDPRAECPNICAYLTSCRLSDENRTTLVEFLGYCLTYDVRLQKALMLIGNGSNGKSVYINLAKAILGNDLVSGESIHSLEEDKYSVANLHGKTLNAHPDLKDSQLQTNEFFNVLTGGDKFIAAQRKYEHPFQFVNTAKLMFSANKLPFARSDNFAYYRRWLLVEFPYTFRDDEIDENLIDKLTTESEKSGFVNMMLEGLKRIRKNRKFSYSLSVEEVEKKYLLHSDNVSIFEEQCIRDCEGSEFPTEKKQVYKWYTTWCKSLNLSPVKEKTFTTRMGKLGRRIFNTTRVISGMGTKHVSYYENTVVDFS